MKRTLLLENQELLDFEVDFATCEIRVLDAPDADDALLCSLGLGGPDRDAFVAESIRVRRMSERRGDAKQILGAFGARSTLELAFRGHGLSLADKLWYRAPGATERWEDVNFFDNDWDAAFCEAVLTHDYKRLASCTPDVPDVTTGGSAVKAWEKTRGGICLLKEPLFENGRDLAGARLAAELCGLLYGQDAHQPLNVVERFGKRFASSPLMLSRDEELVQKMRLFAMGGFGVSDAMSLTGPLSSQDYIDVLARAGVPDASACLARLFAFKVLALYADIHAGNYGIIRNIETGACRAAPPFDYDRSFGFLSREFPFETMCKNPALASILCARKFSGLDSSWDWSWHDPQKLSEFESRIEEAYASFSDLPAGFGGLVAGLFVMQRDYVNEVALRSQAARHTETITSRKKT